MQIACLLDCSPADDPRRVLSHARIIELAAALCRATSRLATCVLVMAIRI